MRSRIWLHTACVTATVILAGMSAGCTTNRTGPEVLCKDKQQKTVMLKIVLNDSLGPIGVKHDRGDDASVVNVCPGDYVRWRAGQTDFEIVFDTDAPFDWSDRKRGGTFVGKNRSGGGNDARNGWQIIDVVRDDAPKGVPLKYNVVTPAGRLDPQIIIDN